MNDADQMERAQGAIEEQAHFCMLAAALKCRMHLLGHRLHGEGGVTLQLCLVDAQSPPMGGALAPLHAGQQYKGVPRVATRRLPPSTPPVRMHTHMQMPDGVRSSADSGKAYLPAKGFQQGGPHRP